jgi:hypothetical protein
LQNKPVFVQNTEQFLTACIGEAMSFWPIDLSDLWGNSQSAGRSSHNFFSSLDFWTGHGNIQEAKRRMTVCYQSGSDRLDLSGLGLSTLPDAIGQLVHLKVLDCHNNDLGSLPHNIDKLSCLEVLDCRYNRLTSLPNEIGSLICLQVLNCSNNQLSSLPYVIKDLRCLKVLNCSDNKLSSLPYEIEELKGNLQELNCENNMFSSLFNPYPLATLRNTRLRFCGNNISEVPRNLRHLNIEIGPSRPVDSPVGWAFLASRPLFEDEVERLSREHNARIAQINAEMERRRSAFEQALNINRREPSQSRHIPIGHRNPQIIFSSEIIFPQLSPSVSIGGFDQLKNELPEARQDLKQLQTPTLQGDQGLWNNLLPWLDLLVLSADFKNPRTCSMTAERVLSIVQMAEKNQAFRHIFSNSLAEAAEDCSDKATFHLTSLEIQKAMIDSQAKSLDQMLKVLKGAFAAGLLEEWARGFVKRRESADRSEFSEEVEAYLALQVKLKERLQLPIGVTEMNHSLCSRLRNSDLAQAEEKVQQGLRDGEKFAAFLVDQKVWKERLTKDFDSERRSYLAPVEAQMQRLDDVKSMGHMDDLHYCNESNRILAEVNAADQTWFKMKTRQLLGLTPSSQVRSAPTPQIRQAPAARVSHAPFSIQPLETVITIKCKDLPNDKALYIRGKGAGLSWDQGVKLARIDWERFEFRTCTPFTGELAYKLLINDDPNMWEVGENHKVTEGKKVECTPTFSKEALPPQAKTILTVDFQLPPGETLCVRGTGPLGKWDYTTPMQSIRNDHCRWYISLDGQFPDFKYKLVLDGRYEQGDNRVAKCGTRSAMKAPKF